MFWFISAVLIVIALVFILPALFKRNEAQDATREQNIAIAKEQLADLERRFEKGNVDEENYQLTRDEIELSLFNDLQAVETSFVKNSENNNSKRVGNWVILLLIPLIAVPTYLKLGNLNFTKQLDPKMAAQDAIKATMPLKPDGTPDIAKIVDNLSIEMQSNPTDPKGWYMLGRSQMMLQRFSDAAESFDKSLTLRPDLAETMLSLADALSMNNSGLLIGRPRKLVNQALTIEPENVTALWLSGMAASQEGEFLTAITQWQKVLLYLDDKPDEKTAVNGLISEAKSRLKPKDLTEIDEKENQTKNSQKDLNNSANKQEIKVNVTLSKSFTDKASANDFVFIYAKAMAGPPMPLAAVRKQVKDLPLDIVLDDNMAMMPDLKLSSFTDVSVVARVSKTGEAIPQNGDLFIEKTGVKLGESISLEINGVYKK